MRGAQFVCCRYLSNVFLDGSCGISSPLGQKTQWLQHPPLLYQRSSFNCKICTIPFKMLPAQLLQKHNNNYNALCNCANTWNQVGSFARNGILTCGAGISSAHLFSKNEELEDVSTRDLKYGFGSLTNSLSVQILFGPVLLRRVELIGYGQWQKNWIAQRNQGLCSDQQTSSPDAHLRITLHPF